MVGTRERLVRYRIHGESLSTDSVGGERAARRLIEKHFGPDDGRWNEWPDDKRWAYGGFHRYCGLNLSLMRRADPAGCAMHLRRAVAIDPSTAQDPEVFYQLGLGTQPPGYRGTRLGADFEAHLADATWVVERMIQPGPPEPDLGPVRGTLLGTAHFAFAILSFHQDRPAHARHHLVRAVRWRPGLLGDARFLDTGLRSLLPPGLRKALRGLWRTAARSARARTPA